MPEKFEVPESFRSAGWKIKIFDKERLEPPHVAVCFKTRKWRWNLRRQAFMDGSPNPRHVPDELVDMVIAKHDEMVETWERMYPHNPVAEDEDHG